MLYDKHAGLDQTGRVLESAADYMDEHGWTRYAVRRDDGSGCIIGAIFHSGVPRPEYADGIERLDAYLVSNGARPPYRCYRFPGDVASLWNDSVCKSKEEAVAALRAAARMK